MVVETIPQAHAQTNNKPQATTCRYCKKPAWDSYFFCPNCGKKLKEPPFVFSWLKTIGVILESLLLPPLGIFPGVKYLRIKNNTARIVGLIAIIITIIMTLVLIILLRTYLNSVSQTYNQIYEMQTGIYNTNQTNLNQINDLQNTLQ